MKIELDTHNPDLNIIESYSIDGVTIKNTLYRNSIIVGPTQLIADWEPQEFDELELHHFRQIIELVPEILLIGTGIRLQFPENKILDSILKENIGVEVMDTGAACRAYNFIAGEGRLVMAALLR